MTTHVPTPPTVVERYRRHLNSPYGQQLHDLAEMPILACELRELVALAERAQAAEPLYDEYGMRVTYISTRTLEATLADNAAEARAVITRLNSEDRDDVVSRTLIHRQAGEWHDVEQDADRG